MREPAKASNRRRTRIAIIATTTATLALLLVLPALASADFSLTIEPKGSGTGTVECEVNAGPAETCAADYPEGTELALVPEASPGSEFVEFYGDCGPAECELIMGEAHTVAAVFDAEAPEEFALSVDTFGSGSGTVECEVEAGPAEECAETYSEGTEVTLMAVADPGSEFVEWIGSCGPEVCELTMDEDQEVTALFEQEPVKFPLTIELEGDGSGTVLCEDQEGPQPCQAEYLEGTELTLYAEPEEGSEFVEFGGDCEPADCELVMDQEHTVTASFKEEPGPRKLTIGVVGEGTVECEVEGGEPELCEAKYEEGTELTLVPSPDEDFEFAGFSSGTGSASACTGTSLCTFTLETKSSVTATFTAIPKFNLKVNKGGTGAGTVTSSPAGIGCGGDCEEEYTEGTEVTLTASAASGSTFAGWTGGGCSGTGTCVVTVEADATVTATFEASSPPPPPPPPPAVLEGKAKAAGTASVKGGKASLKLTCSGGPCKGTLKLTAKVKQGAKKKNLAIGKASFALAEGASRTLKVKLSGAANKELGAGRTLKAKLTGTGIAASTVKLKPIKKKQ